MCRLNRSLGFVLLTGIFNLVATQQPPKPNLVVIVSDDMVIKFKFEMKYKNNLAVKNIGFQ